MIFLVSTVGTETWSKKVHKYRKIRFKLNCRFRTGVWSLQRRFLPAERRNPPVGNVLCYNNLYKQEVQP